MCTSRPLLLALALALGCGDGGDPAATVSAGLDPQPRADPDPSAGGLAGGNKVLPVMTRNLYLGADLAPVIAARTPGEFLAATTAVWAMVQRNDFNVRARAIADEIAAHRPALVGLQEAYLWRTQSPGDAIAGGTTPATTVAFDDVEDLLDALAARGLTYRVAAEVELFDFEAPVLTATGSDDVRMTDRGVILAREDVHTEAGEGHVFPEATLLPISVMGQDLLVERGWVSTLVKYRGEWLRFASTHLEAYDASARVAQAQALGAALEGEALPVVLVGDLNSTPGTEGEAALAGFGFQDAWAALEDGAPGLTCCFLEDLTVLATLGTRIDYVLFRGELEPRAIEVVGGEAQVSGLWPSDHAGVSAALRIALPGLSGTGQHP